MPSLLKYASDVYGRYDWRNRSGGGAEYSNFAAEEELEKCRRVFDPEFYNSMYPDVKAAGADAFSHYMNNGFLEDRDPYPEFDTYYYKCQNLNEAEATANPLVHYVRVGGERGVKTRSDSTLTLDVDTPYKPSMRVCVHAHCFYPELLGEMLPGLENLPKDAHIVVTVVSEADFHFAKCYVREAKITQTIDVRLVRNRGRDLIPFLLDCKDVWERFDLVLHIHSKASPHTDWGNDWRRYLFDQLLGSKAVVSAALRQFEQDAKLGMLYPTNYSTVKRATAFEMNMATIASLLSRITDDMTLLNSNDFAAGSMAWFRTKAILPLAESIKDDEIGEEDGSIDGTIAHALERLLAMVVRSESLTVRDYTTARRSLLKPRSDAPHRSGFRAPVGLRWTRDTPKIARRPPLPLQSDGRAFNRKCMDISWVMPSFVGPGAGGHMTIFRMVRFFEQFGHHQTVWIQNALQFSDQQQAKDRISAWYQPMGANVSVLFLP